MLALAARFLSISCSRWTSGLSFPCTTSLADTLLPKWHWNFLLIDVRMGVSSACVHLSAWSLLPLVQGSILGDGFPYLPIRLLRLHTWSMPGWLSLYSVRVSTCSGTSPWVCRRCRARRSFLGPK